jgi:hypothetical protein
MFIAALLLSIHSTLGEPDLFPWEYGSFFLLVLVYVAEGG